jgi:hypothetical protein
MINSLWIPPKCIFNKIRLLVWFLLANFAFREIYEEIKHSENKNQGHEVGGKLRWLCFLVTFVEVFVSLKFIKGAGNIIEDFVTPVYVYVPWIVVVTILCLYYVKIRYF